MNINKLKLHENNYKKVIEFMYNNIETINDEINKYIVRLRENKIKNDVDFKQENKINDNKSFASIFRINVLNAIDILHKTTLYSKNEVANGRNRITYIVTIADDILKIKLFCLYIIVFNLETKLRHTVLKKNDSRQKVHVGLDYEFLERKIALMQLNFETYSTKDHKTNSYIWLVNPGEFDDDMTNILLHKLMTYNGIYKILHGSDSLDIPYMYNIMFKNNKDTILKFTSKIFDTRFLCEYFRLSIDESKKCSIYNALQYFGTISEKKLQDLETTHDLMGPVQDVSWNIHKLSSFHVKYA